MNVAAAYSRTLKEAGSLPRDPCGMRRKDDLCGSGQCFCYLECFDAVGLGSRKSIQLVKKTVTLIPGVL